MPNAGRGTWEAGATPAPARRRGGTQTPGTSAPQSGHAPSAVTRFERTRNPERETTVASHDGHRVSSHSPTRPGRFPA